MGPEDCDPANEPIEREEYEAWAKENQLEKVVPEYWGSLMISKPHYGASETGKQIDGATVGEVLEEALLAAAEPVDPEACFTLPPYDLLHVYKAPAEWIDEYKLVDGAWVKQ